MITEPSHLVRDDEAKGMQAGHSRQEKPQDKDPRRSQGPKEIPSLPLLSLPCPGENLLQVFEDAKSGHEWTCRESKFSRQESNPLSRRRLNVVDKE